MKKTDLRIKASFYEALANLVMNTEESLKWYLNDDGSEPTFEDSKTNYYYVQAYKLLIKRLEELEP